MLLSIQGIGTAEQQLSVITDRGHGPLREEADLVLREFEIFMIGKEFARCRIVEFAGHDIPGNGTAVFFRYAPDFLGKILEQGMTGNGTDRIGAFRAIVFDGNVTLPASTSFIISSSLPSYLSLRFCASKSNVASVL